MSEAEYPEDEQRSDDVGPAEPAVPSEAEAVPEEEAATTPETGPFADAEPAGEAGSTPETGPFADAEPAGEAEPTPETGPFADAEPAVEAGSTPEAGPVEEAESAEPAPTPEVMAELEADEPELEELEIAPRLRPEIPGADLIPDIVPEGEEFLDAEARAAAEAEAEAAAAHAQEEPDDEPRPIADAAIDLAAGARYTATGKRKTAVARVILKPGTGTYSINGKQLDSYFPRETLQRVIRQPLETVGYESRMDVVARMHGGGVSAQAGALRHGISRALIVADPHLRGELKRRGFLTRDPRVKERKKAGLKKARKRPQFSKR